MFQFRLTAHLSRAFIAAAVLLAVPLSASAFRVKPLIIQLEPAGDGATASLLVENTKETALALEFSASERDIADDGSETEIPADDDFLIFPPQAIVAPGKTQRIQIRYLGDAAEQSRAYRLHVEQADIDVAESGQRVGFSVAFHPAIYVTPDGAKFDVAVTNIAPANDGYTVTAKNSGNRHAVLTSGDWNAVDSSGASALIDLKAANIKQAPMIAPGQTRTIFIPRSALNGLADLTTLTISPTR